MPQYESTYHHQKLHKPLIRKNSRLLLAPSIPRCCTKVWHMANTFLTKSRHGTVFYFRWRIPEAARSGLGQSMYVQSLATSDRRLAIVRARILAVHTDLLF